MSNNATMASSVGPIITC